MTMVTIAVAGPGASAAIRHVPGGYPTIQAGLDAAGPGDTVLVAAGTYAPSTTGESFPITMSVNAVLVSESGPASTIIDAEGTNTVLYCSGLDSTARIEGFTISGGLAPGTTWPYDCGGGIRIMSCSPTVADCVLFANAAEREGGGAWCYDHASPHFRDCTFIDNSAPNGGGLHCRAYCDPVLTHCTFTNNAATDGNGGGLYSDGYSVPQLTDCTFVGNSGGYGGGSFCTTDSSPAFTGCVFSGNRASYDGGAMSNIGWCHVSATGCVFSGNSAAIVGGAAHFTGWCEPTFADCTFAANVTGEGWDGSAIAIYQGDVTVDNSVFAFNLEGEVIFCDDESSATLTCCDVYGNEAGDWVGCIAGQEGSDGNISADPQFCDLAGEDFGLRSTSPCAEEVNPECGQIGARPIGCTHVVNADGSGEFATIQAAVNAAADRDTVLLCDGTFTGSGNRNIDFLGKAITIRSLGGDPATCIIDCEQASRGVIVSSGEESDSILEGVTITRGHTSGGGYADCGGGIYCRWSNPTVRNCVIHDCSSGGQGGGMWCIGASPTISDCAFSNNHSGIGGGLHCFSDSSPMISGCTFMENSASSQGGGLLCQDHCNPTVRDCSFIGNTADFYAGMLCWYYDAPEVTDCTFSHNAAVYDGGGMGCSNGSTPSISGCTFFGNTAGQDGGGLRTDTSSTPTLTDCTFLDNTAAHRGGGMGCQRFSGSLTDCTFAGNAAGWGGGGVSLSNSPASLTNCTFYGNSTESEGAGVYCSNSSPTLDNTIIAFSTQGEAVYCLSGDPALTCCDIYGNAGGDYVDCISGDNGVNGNISLDPLFCDAAHDEFTLRSDSPCAPYSAPNPSCDLIGAWSVACDPPGDSDGDGDVDLDDYSAFETCLGGSGGGLRRSGCSCFDFDDSGDIDLKDFGGFQVAFTGSR